jgi:hypothetical protein
MCLYAVSPFSDRIYGTVTVRYGPKPYYTVKMKLLYGSGTVRETGTGNRSTVFWPFCREKGGPGFESWSEPHLLLFSPIFFCAFSLKQGITVSHYKNLLQNICIEGNMSQKWSFWCKNRRQSWSFWCQLGTFLVLIRAFKLWAYLAICRAETKLNFNFLTEAFKV